ncbi:hydrolase [Spirochaetia bacterium]|nr:hydrolase [Spirochaetia bacterium]
MEQLLANYSALVEESARACSYPYSYLSPNRQDIPAWQKAGRNKLVELLSYNPPSCEMNPRILSRLSYDGLSVELIAYNEPFGPPTEGFFLKPLNHTGKLPGIIALHDHGGFMYFGKEKLTAFPGEPEILREFKDRYYGGVSWASELAKRGYAVFAPDVFLWGSRKMIVEEIPEEFTGGVLSDKEPGSREYIEAYNQFTKENETFLTKSLFLAGITWPGVTAYEDLRALDYLLSRPEVDPEKIGCGGFSGGGLRADFLAGLDSRVRCTVCTSFMSTFAQTVKSNINNHSWQIHLPHLANYMDLPDVASLSGGRPLLAQYNMSDRVWVLEGQQEADKKLKRIYEKMNLRGNYSGVFYSGSHKFDLPMQEDAFSWFDRWLK